MRRLAGPIARAGAAAAAAGGERKETTDRTCPGRYGFLTLNQNEDRPYIHLREKSNEENHSSYMLKIHIGSIDVFSEYVTNANSSRF